MRGPKPQVQRYVRAICVAAARLESLFRDLYRAVRDRTATERLFFARRYSPCRAVYRHSLCNSGALEFVENVGRELGRELKMACESGWDSGGKRKRKRGEWRGKWRENWREK